MKNNSFSLIVALCTVLFVSIACNQAGETTPPANSTGTAPANTASSPSTQSASQPAKDISGSYSAEGSNPNGGAKYQADLTVAKRGDVYQFSWTSGGMNYDGVGVQVDNSVAVAFTEGLDGKGCGVVLYKIAGDGSLDGKAGYWGVNEFESEKAIRSSGSDLEGTYDVTGKNTEGSEYKGTLKVNKDGEGYGFAWNTGTPLTGFGVKSGDKAAVGIGGNQCGFVLYDTKGDGTLDGRWGGKGSKSFGTEIAKKK